MKPDAMLVIDVQNGLINAHPYRENELLQNIARLISACRNAAIPVLYVRHDGGDEFLTHGTPDWENPAAIAPETGEQIFEKNVNSAFRGTELHACLQGLKVRNLLICGMQTEYCVDTNVKVAFELGYHVIVPKGGTSTFDKDWCTARDLIAYYENDIWNPELAEVLSMEDILTRIGCDTQAAAIPGN